MAAQAYSHGTVPGNQPFLSHRGYTQNDNRVPIACTPAHSNWVENNVRGSLLLALATLALLGTANLLATVLALFPELARSLLDLRQGTVLSLATN